MLELIEVYSTSRNQQCEIDFVYAKFCDVVFNETLRSTSHFGMTH